MSSQYPISSYPLEKYSYSVTHATEANPSSSQLQWTHYAHRDNLYFVIDTPLATGPLRNTYLKVVWASQTLEFLDLTSLSQRTLPAADPLLPPQPALLSIARPPCLAIRYPGQDGQTIRRFQIRFPSETIFNTAKVILESLNFPIQAAQSQSRQAQIREQHPQHPSQLQVVQRNTCSRGTTALGNTILLPETQQIPHISHVSPQDTLSHSTNLGFDPPQPPNLTSSIHYNPSPLPPPRTLPDYMNLSGTNIGKEPPNSVIPVEDLPPLRKPTPASKLTRAVRAESVVQPQPIAASSTIFANKGSNIDAVSDCACPDNFRGIRLCNPTSVQKSSRELVSSEIGSMANYSIPHKVPDVPETSQFGSSPPLIIKQNCWAPQDESNKRVRFEVSATPPLVEVPLSSSVGASTHKQNMGVALTPTILSTPSEGLGEGEEVRTEQLRKERFCALENLIVNKIHDDDFCKLVCDVGKVWQRMGFEQVFENGKLFHIGDEDLE